MLKISWPGYDLLTSVNDNMILLSWELGFYFHETKNLTKISEFRVLKEEHGGIKYTCI